MQDGIVKLVIANLLLQFLDGVASYHILATGVPEVNPMIANYIETWGLAGGLLYGKLIGCALVMVIFLLRKRVERFAVRGLTLLAYLYSCLGVMLMTKMILLYV